MATLKQLHEPAAYRACDWDLRADAVARRYWIDNFRTHVAVLIEALRSAGVSAGSAEQFARDYDRHFAAVEAQAETLPRVDILYLDEVRQRVLDAHGFVDPYQQVKQRETSAALKMLPELLRELDHLPADARPERLAEGLLAGNIFDLGSIDAMQRYAEVREDFSAARRRLTPRPWFVDDVPRWAQRWRECGWRHVLMLIDNAGPDVCLGCLPLARELTRRGSVVTLAANTRPALNDVTAPELAELVAAAASFDPIIRGAMARGSLRVVASGGWAPLIDLTQLDEKFVAETADVDLLHLHGMGRAVESNWRARFACDALWSAVLKDGAVSRRLAAPPFGCIFRFERQMH